MNSTKVNILKLMCKKRELTQQAISKELDISIPTVISYINELIKEGLLDENGVALSTGGRKPLIIRFLPNSRFTFGADITPEKVTLILTNLDSDILYQEEFCFTHPDLDVIMENLSHMVKKAIMLESIQEQKVIGIGISLPGTVNDTKLTLEVAPNMGFINVDFNKYSHLFIFPMFIENEAIASAIGEQTLGIAKGLNNLVYISITQGIGTGIVLNGNIYKGKNKRAGEFGHMRIVPNGKLCRCGRRGCWEMYASERALIDGFKEISGLPVESLPSLFSLYNPENKLFNDYFQNYLDYLALGIQNIILILDPDYIVIGGELSEFSDLYMDDLQDKVFARNSLYHNKDVKLVSSRLQNNSSILGASLLPIKRKLLILGSD